MAERFYLNTIWDQEKIHRLLPAKLKNILGAPNQILYYQCG